MEEVKRTCYGVGLTRCQPLGDPEYRLPRQGIGTDALQDWADWLAWYETLPVRRRIWSE